VNIILYCVFRSHQRFLDDVLEGFIIAAALRHFGIEIATEAPKQNKPPPIFPAYSKDGQYKWVSQHAKQIRDNLILNETSDIGNAVTRVYRQEQGLLQTQAESGRYQCPYCVKSYKKVTGLKKHLKIKHGQVMEEDRDRDIVMNNTVPDPSVPTLIKLLFLQHDTCDAFKFGDGDRAMRNAKFEFLYLYALKHTKYRLWLWRMLAYDMALLSPRQAMEYRWNVSVNTKGVVGNCIPNDNFVEVQVKNIKKNVARQGPNKSFHTAQVACKTTQVVTEIRNGLRKASDRHNKSSAHSTVDVTCDVLEIATCVRRAGLVDNPGQTLDGFDDFKEPISKIRPFELHKWINEQQKTAAQYMS
jgi:hypothetical protein